MQGNLDGKFINRRYTRLRSPHEDIIRLYLPTLPEASKQRLIREMDAKPLWDRQSIQQLIDKHTSTAISPELRQRAVESLCEYLTRTG